MQKQILTLHEQGYKIRAIVRSLGVSRKTVRKVLRGESQGTGPPVSPGDWRLKIDWEWTRGEVFKKGVTVQQLHRELAPEVPYVSFWRALRRRIPVAPEVTIRLRHKPGEKTQIDYADGISITDRRTGVKTKTHLFCGVLSFSSYTFGEFVFNQKLPTFLASQERMFHFFGGVTPYVVVDNLKAGVHQAHWYDPDVNPTYCDFANHMGFAVVPARPYRPRDKGKTESHIGVIQRSFYQEVRNRTFYALAELNEAFRAYLHRLNRAVMKDYGVNRWDRFEEEKKLLRSLPSSRFEITEWKQAKVHPDCHIQVEKNFYSIPFAQVGRTVRVRLGTNLVEVFSEEGDSLAVHPRLLGLGTFSTQEAHYPEAKLATARFDLHAAKKQAQAIGPHTQALIEHLLDGAHPLRFLRRIQGILRLIKSKQVSEEAMEYACAQAKTFGKMRLSYIKACALHYMRHGRRPVLVAPARQAELIHLHHKGASHDG